MQRFPVKRYGRTLKLQCTACRNYWACFSWRVRKAFFCRDFSHKTTQNIKSLFHFTRFQYNYLKGLWENLFSGHHWEKNYTGTPWRRLDYQPLFGKRVRAPPRTHGTRERRKSSLSVTFPSSKRTFSALFTIICRSWFKDKSDFYYIEELKQEHHGST